jgi:hypothetical protein
MGTFKVRHSFSYDQLPNHKFVMSILQDGELMFEPAECKDYFQDVYWSEYVKKKTGTIYGLSWAPGRIDISRPTQTLYIHAPYALAGEAAQMQAFLQAFDRAQGMTPSVVEVHDERTLLIHFDTRWTRSGPMLSAYTSLVRLSGQYDGGNIDLLLTRVDLTRQTRPEATPECCRNDVLAPRFRALLMGKTSEAKWIKSDKITSVHFDGVCMSPTFPEERSYIPGLHHK